MVRLEETATQQAMKQDYMVDDPTDWTDIVNGYAKACAAQTTLYVVDPHLCEPTVYEAALIKLYSLGVNAEDISPVYFENNATQCMLNIQSRKGLKANSLHDIYALTLHYKPPAKTIPVYNTTMQLSTTS